MWDLTPERPTLTLELEFPLTGTDRVATDELAPFHRHAVEVGAVGGPHVEHVVLLTVGHDAEVLGAEGWIGDGQRILVAATADGEGLVIPQQVEPRGVVGPAGFEGVPDSMKVDIWWVQASVKSPERALAPLNSLYQRFVQREDWHNGALVAAELLENFFQLGRVEEAKEFAVAAGAVAFKMESCPLERALTTVAKTALLKEAGLRSAAKRLAQVAKRQVRQNPNRPG